MSKPTITFDLQNYSVTFTGFDSSQDKTISFDKHTTSLGFGAVLNTLSKELSGISVTPLEASPIEPEAEPLLDILALENAKLTEVPMTQEMADILDNASTEPTTPKKEKTTKPKEDN